MSGTPPPGAAGDGAPAEDPGRRPPGPTRPALSRQQVAELAASAVGEGPGSVPDTHLRALREQRVLEGLAVAEDAAWAAALAREWATARQEALDLLAMHGQQGGRVRAEANEVLDACAVQLLTDPEAPGRLRRRLRESLVGRQLPPWFAAALDPQARVGRLLAAALLLPEVQAAAEPDEVAEADETQPLPRVERPPPTTAATGCAATGAAATGGADRGTAGADRGAAAAGPATPSPRSGSDRDGPAGWRRAWTRVAGALVAPALALLGTAAGLRWPALTALAVVAWVVVDRVVSLLADPFLRLVGGWPPTIRGWAVVWLPFRLVGVLLRGPWRLLGGLLLLVLWGLAVDRGLTWLHGLLGARDPDLVVADAASFTARWFVPVVAAGLVWQATRRRVRRPPLRGAAAAGASLRALPAGVGGLLLIPAVVLLLLAAAAPAERPWAPYEDHRAALAAWLPADGWDEADSRWWDTLTGWLPGVADGPGSSPPGDDTEVATWQVVDATALNVRGGSGTAEPILDSLPGGAVVEGTGRTEMVDGASWVEVRLPDGRTGWAAGRFLAEVEP